MLLSPRIVIRGEFLAQSLMTPWITSLGVYAVLLCAWTNTYEASSCKPQTERFSMFFVLSLWYRFSLTNDKDIGYAALLCKQ